MVDGSSEASSRSRLSYKIKVVGCQSCDSFAEGQGEIEGMKMTERSKLEGPLSSGRLVPSGHMPSSMPHQLPRVTIVLVTFPAVKYVSSFIRFSPYVEILVW